METNEEFEQFYRAQHRSLRTLARRLARTDEDADDLLQATFERALLKFSSFKHGSNGRGWLGRIMTRLYIDQWRRRQWTVPIPVGALEVPAPQPDDEPWWLSLTAADLQLALTELPVEQRELVEAYAYSGQSYSRLAGKMGLLATTVGSRLFRTRRRLRETLLRHHGSRPLPPLQDQA